MITLKPTAHYHPDLTFAHSEFTALRLYGTSSGTYVFARDGLFGQKDLPGLFAGYILE